jgi:amidase
MTAVAGATDLARSLGALRVGPAVLAEGAGTGSLAGVPVVVKDLIDVAGERTGAGTPDRLAGQVPAPAHATAVARLLAAGAVVVGKAHTDELAFSLSGTNVHYGTPRNPAALGRVPGGSSSGSASAVAGGLVPLALGTDTGGSIRVPASYCGIAGLRPSHGRVPCDGVVLLAPSYCTVGVLAATGALLERAGLALLAAPPAPPVTALVVADDLLAVADPPVAAAVAAAADDLARRLGVPVRRGSLGGPLGTWLGAFRGRQLVEAWAEHGPWITAARPRLGPGIAARFEAARVTPADAAVPATGAGADVRRRLEDLLPTGAALVLPSAPTVAPPPDLTGPAKDDLRDRTLQLTCVAGLGGLPALSLPLASVAGRPVGCCLVGRRFDDERLLATARLASP